MANEHESAEDIIEVADIVEDVVDGVDKTDWKAIALDRHELAKKNFGIAKRYKTASTKEKPPVEQKPNQQQNQLAQLDYGQKAFLIANGIKEADEIEFVQKVMSESGKSLDEVVASKYFQGDLKDMREAKAAKDAIPPGSKRSAQSQRNEVDYWIAKGELPPRDQVELRRKVVNARIKQEQDKSMFTDTPVVGESR